jgi:hypothetical protein
VRPRKRQGLRCGMRVAVHTSLPSAKPEVPDSLTAPEISKKLVVKAM